MAGICVIPSMSALHSVLVSLKSSQLFFFEVPFAVGADNTGSGGGGGSIEPYAGGGGPGVVIIRYQKVE